VPSRNSHLNINSCIVSSDYFSISKIVPGQLSCNTLLSVGADIYTQIVTKNQNSSGSYNHKKLELMLVIESLLQDNNQRCTYDIYTLV
jgi:hypothetical protein